MAKDNKTIGKYKLKGIKRAPAGGPQIEVTFDLDANGILKVSAKDLDTGKAQSITITADQRMSDSEIEQAIREAQEYAGSDQLRREAMDLTRECQELLTNTQHAMDAAGKTMDKAKKKQIKKDMNALQKPLGKLRLDKVTEEELAYIREMKAQLENSSCCNHQKQV